MHVPRCTNSRYKSVLLVKCSPYWNIENKAEITGSSGLADSVPCFLDRWNEQSMDRVSGLPCSEPYQRMNGTSYALRQRPAKKFLLKETEKVSVIWGGAREKKTCEKKKARERAEKKFFLLPFSM